MIALGAHGLRGGSASSAATGLPCWRIIRPTCSNPIRLRIGAVRTDELAPTVPELRFIVGDCQPVVMFYDPNSAMRRCFPQPVACDTCAGGIHGQRHDRLIAGQPGVTPEPHA
jgi:hypothetical protein